MVRCAVVGASGYSGAELVSLLAVHPGVEIASIHGSSMAGRRWEDLYPGRRHVFQGEIERFEPSRLYGLDVVFLALPHGESAVAASRLAGRVGHLIDLSGDLRLESEASYRKWYGMEHPAPELLGKAVYGLPELFGGELPGAGLVACAGCYATVSQLAAAPALRKGGGSPAKVTISAMSGTSGAGRKADVSLGFSEVSQDLRAYKVGRHQHSPEIALGLSRAVGRDVALTFIPHLVPVTRGILATVVVGQDGGSSADALLETYRTFYQESPFVRVVDPGVRLPAVRDVAGTNFCDLAPSLDEAGGSMVIVGVIDNLIKGAAGQAVQVMNLVLGMDETMGLITK